MESNKSILIKSKLEGTIGRGSLIRQKKKLEFYHIKSSRLRIPIKLYYIVG